MKKKVLFYESNYRLLEEWMNLNRTSDLAFPFLICPTPEYLNRSFRVLVADRETNGWGDKEFQVDSMFIRSADNLRNLAEELTKLYDEKINKNWEVLGSVWPSYYKLRSLSEGLNTDAELEGEIGFLKSNVALIGNKYGKRGFDKAILPLLQRAWSEQLKILNPTILLLRIGFGTKSNAEDYLSILEGGCLGKLTNQIQIRDCPTLYELEFENQEGMKIFGCRHPQGFKNGPIIEYLAALLKRMVKKSI